MFVFINKPFRQISAVSVLKRSILKGFCEHHPCILIFVVTLASVFPCCYLRCQFSTFEQCQEWLKRLNVVVRPPSRLEDLFSFAFHAWCMEVYAGEKEQHGELCRPGTLLSLTCPHITSAEPPLCSALVLSDISALSVGEHVTSWFKNEVERMGFDTQNAWRISDINSKFR